MSRFAVAAFTAILVVACYNIVTDTPGWVALGMYCASVLGIGIGVEGHKLTQRWQ